MSEVSFTESVVEEAALAWLESLGYAVKHGPDITPGGETPTLTQSERESYSQVVLAERLRRCHGRISSRWIDSRRTGATPGFR
jgi:type I restriction enzyme R subunit